jgi:hypothetical protein
MICFAASHMHLLTYLYSDSGTCCPFVCRDLPSSASVCGQAIDVCSMAVWNGTGSWHWLSLYHLSLDLPVCDATKSCRLSLAQLADCAGSCSWRELPVRSVAALKCCRLVVVDQAADQAYNLNPLFLYPPSLIPYVFRSSGP